MKSEDKELLLKDLCARLPYGVKVYNNSFGGVDAFTLVGCDGEELIDDERYWYRIGDCKPYLFPLSSMTEEQKKELKSFDPFVSDEVKTFGDWAIRLVDFYNKHHLDFRGLIPMGLAIDATNLDIY